MCLKGTKDHTHTREQSDTCKRPVTFPRLGTLSLYIYLIGEGTAQRGATAAAATEGDFVAIRGTSLSLSLC